MELFFIFLAAAALIALGFRLGRHTEQTIAAAWEASETANASDVGAPKLPAHDFGDVLQIGRTHQSDLAKAKAAVIAPTNDQNSTVGIFYADANGEITERVITIHAIRNVEYTGSTFIDAWCQLRGDMRTFRPERILSYFDPSTKAPIQTSLVPDPLAAQRNAGPNVELNRFFNEHRVRFERAGCLATCSFDRATLETTLACFRPHKRTGLPLKRPTLILKCSPFFIDEIVDTPNGPRAILGARRRKSWAVIFEERFLGSWEHYAEAATQFEESFAAESPSWIKHAGS